MISRSNSSAFPQGSMVAIIVSWILFSGCIFASEMEQPTAMHTPAGDSNFERVDGLIGMLSVWVNILALLVTSVIGVAAFHIFNHYKQAEKYADKLRAELVSNTEKEITKLKETYQLVALKPPSEILRETRSEYEPLVESLRATLERHADEFESRIVVTERNLSMKDEEVRRDIEATIHRLTELGSDVASLMRLQDVLKTVPRTEEILRDIESRFKPYIDVQEAILRKVLDAFLQVENLSTDERRAVSRVLTARVSRGPTEPAEEPAEEKV